MASKAVMIRKNENEVVNISGNDFVLGTTPEFSWKSGEKLK
jgi:hypothetical protein